MISLNKSVKRQVLWGLAGLFGLGSIRALGLWV